MNTILRTRGILAASAMSNPAQIFAELRDSIHDFKANSEQEIRGISRNVDELNAKFASFAINSGFGAPAPDRRANAAVIEFMRTGNPDAMQKFTANAAMSTDYGPGGGFAVPVEIDGMIATQLIAFSPMRALASHALISTSDYHKLVNRRGATSGWAGETDPRTETETPNLAEIVPPQGELWAYPSITQWMLDDAAFNLEDFIRENVIEEFALQEGTAFVAGNGIKKPMGFLSLPFAATDDATRPFGTWQYVVTGAAADFATTAPADCLIDLVYKVTSPYRVGQGVGWLMNSKTAGRVRKFKDGQGNYLWSESTQLGQPSILLGYPVFLDETMPDIAANAYPIAFGNWQKGYLIVDRVGTRIVRDQVTKPGWLKLYINKRVGGHPLDTKAVKFLKIST